MNISLTTQQEKFIQSQLQTGNYSSADEVIGEALRLLEEHHRQLGEKQIEELRHKIASGTEQIAKGQLTDGEVVFARLREKINQISESQA
ncbi:type II toxin-antitoxin system ParD family antitoxin [Planktothrix sp. FACHB-1355]|uniref:Type II toxin-antitoxin system ParD family antitoxin n=1 Tax=Aerosakkonema funiforme FACHB-1375 TaxID=2949571 RepID=A0A926ZJ61_9CYAN|nr:MULTISPECIES: type II toxin-antitoxin system ParD family antitoxin [Oscillatoriales]MBD2184670.1 type II toxin-antitoxin system ParD family antitoxin [Aerosakkonema funiforme FACHB-1375]MBD3558750.1 type II toxin-antitoxin system ParD family antitoxin [Planktothrix sp. FACHB-1355]